MDTNTTGIIMDMAMVMNRIIWMRKNKSEISFGKPINRSQEIHERSKEITVTGLGYAGFAADS